MRSCRCRLTWVVWSTMLWMALPAVSALDRAGLVALMMEKDASVQVEKLAQLREKLPDDLVRLLSAWRGGEVYVYEQGERTIPFVLTGQPDADGGSQGLSLLDGAALRESPTAEPLVFAPHELVPVEASAPVRRLIKTYLDIQSLTDPDLKTRRDAAIKLGQEQVADYLPYFQQQLALETSEEMKRSLRESIALTQLKSDTASVVVGAIEQLGQLRSLRSLTFLEVVQKNPVWATDPAVQPALRATRVAIERYQAWGTFFGTFFRGLSLGAVLLVAAMGLAITFGLMGVINMAHGELMMVGAYTVYVTETWARRVLGTQGLAYDSYFLLALALSFVAAAVVGLILERGIIRFLYHRPLESLLATWGVSLVLQQAFRHVFGSANVQVASPRWLSGSFEINDVLLAYNRLFVIGFAIAIVTATLIALAKTSLGLQIRGVMQNRAMAAALGVRTERVNMATFALGSGLAGMAGACLSQIGNVGPSLGQNYIIDCFMVVVLGGVGSLIGTVTAAFGVGLTDQILQPHLGAVMGKITVLTGIILFLQWKPGGLFPARGRGLEG